MSRERRDRARYGRAIAERDGGAPTRRPQRRSRPPALGSGGDRMPPLPWTALDDAQRAAAAELAAGPRGGVIGPFIATLRSPKLTSRLQRLGEYLRYRNVLGPRLTELAILLTARAWSQQFEWSLHVESAAAQGIPRRVIDAIARGRRPIGMRTDESVVYHFLEELRGEQAVSDRVYARAVAAFGEAGVIDLIAVAGYYATLAMILNVARTPLPADLPPKLPTLARKRRRRGRTDRASS